jgi:hypothetical protein
LDLAIAIAGETSPIHQFPIHQLPRLGFKRGREAMTSNLNCLGAILIVLLLSHHLPIKVLKMMDGSFSGPSHTSRGHGGTRLKAV